MKNNTYDVIIIGGSYSGLAAAMALGRSLKNVLIIDSGKPCNRQTPHSHNFITHDGKTPKEIARLALEQLKAYPTLESKKGLAIKAQKTAEGFTIRTSDKNEYRATSLLFATGVKDIMPPIEGFAECWGISVLHCPYCHGYEVRGKKTGIWGNGDVGYHLAALISNWTNDLTLYTDGPSTLSDEEQEKLTSRGITLIEKKIERLEHHDGYLKHLVFKDGSTSPLEAMYARTPFEQHCTLPEDLGCELDENGYLVVDDNYKTTEEGIYAAGDNTTRKRTVANAVAMGTMAGMMLNNQLIFQSFE